LFLSFLESAPQFSHIFSIQISQPHKRDIFLIAMLNQNTDINLYFAMLLLASTFCIGLLTNWNMMKSFRVCSGQIYCVFSGDAEVTQLLEREQRRIPEYRADTVLEEVDT
jgi:hypothetical protein